MTRPMPDLPPYGLHLFDFSLRPILPIALLESLLDWMELRG